MKKIILSAVVAAMTFGSFTAAAKDNNKDNKQAATEQQCPMQRDGKKMQKCPFEGLNLSDAQKEQLKQLQESRRAEFAKQKNAKKEAKKAAKDQKVADRKQVRRDHLAKIKAILTPEQYVTFLENNFVDGGRHHKGMTGKGHKAGKGQRPGKGNMGQPGHMGQRPQGPRPQQQPGK
ncbi:MAG: hypothetical protein K2M97_02625 [Muribaculaceae bacterium]|nr:hypothetical protein [Muribaculaceae bacterium]